MIALLLLSSESRKSHAIAARTHAKVFPTKETQVKRCIYKASGRGHMVAQGSIAYGLPQSPGIRPLRDNSSRRFFSSFSGLTESFLWARDTCRRRRPALHCYCIQDGNGMAAVLFGTQKNGLLFSHFLKDFFLSELELRQFQSTSHCGQKTINEWPR